MAKKQKRIDLRKEARGRECAIRIPQICNGNSETVVLCHLNNKALFGAGIGLKVPDIFGAWGCQACHDAVDGRDGWTHQTTKDAIQTQFFEAVFRTQNQLLKEGKIKI